MKSIVIAALFASTNAVKLEWPSVARCAPGQISTDFHPCDDNSKGPHHLDGTQVQLDALQDRFPLTRLPAMITLRDHTTSMEPLSRLIAAMSFSSVLTVLDSRSPRTGHQSPDATQDRSL